jgi:SNF2 family DNA or RNA helicase
MAEHMLAKIDGGLVAAVNPLTQMIRLSQFASAFAELHEDQSLELQAPSNKIDALMDIMDELGDEQVVVFAESRQLIELAAKKLTSKKIKFGQVVGDASTLDRARDIDLFQEGRLQVMLATFGAGGEGITLTAARVAVFLQRPWSLVQSKQAEDRIHRPGAEVHESIEIIDVISKGTIEEYRLVRLAQKEDMLQEVVRDEVLRSLLTYRGE